MQLDLIMKNHEELLNCYTLNLINQHVPIERNYSVSCVERKSRADIP